MIDHTNDMLILLYLRNQTTDNNKMLASQLFVRHPGGRLFLDETMFLVRRPNHGKNKCISSFTVKHAFVYTRIFVSSMTNIKKKVE